MVNCKCLCGEIEFVVDEVPGMTFNCHCSRCRKSHGAAFSTQVIGNKFTLKFLKGKKFVSKYNSKGAIRSFCSKCGARLMNYDKGEGNYLSIAVSAINNSKDYRPIGECFVNEKLNFVELDESIPHYEKLPEIFYLSIKEDTFS